VPHRVTVWPRDADEFRQRVRKMSDAQLVRCSESLRYMTDPRNSYDKKTVQTIFRCQLKTCITEWKRRHPKQARVSKSSGSNSLSEP
jgi:hypothetical protein